MISIWAASITTLGKTIYFSEGTFTIKIFRTASGSDNIPGLPHQKYFRNQNVALDYTHTFNSNLINTAVFGFTRIGHHRGPTASLGWNNFGGPATTARRRAQRSLHVDQWICIHGGRHLCAESSDVAVHRLPELCARQTHHELWRRFPREAVNRVEDYYTDPIFNFNGQYSGNSLSDLLLGLPDYYNLQTEVSSRLRSNAFDGYAQDNYKVTQRVTIDAGIRWEPFLPPVDNLNDQICYDPTFSSQSKLLPDRASRDTFPGTSLGQRFPGQRRFRLPTLHGA